MKPEESALGNALLSLTLWLSDVYAAAVEAFHVTGELGPGNISKAVNLNATVKLNIITSIFRSKSNG